MKILDFFLFLWVIFALLDPDPDLQFEPATKINADPDTDPDPKPCFFHRQKRRLHKNQTSNDDLLKTSS